MWLSCLPNTTLYKKPDLILCWFLKCTHSPAPALHMSRIAGFDTATFPHTHTPRNFPGMLICLSVHQTASTVHTAYLVLPIKKDVLKTLQKSIAPSKPHNTAFKVESKPREEEKLFSYPYAPSLGCDPVDFLCLLSESSAEGRC